MKRTVSAVLIGAGCVAALVPTGAHAALGTSFGEYKLHAATNEHLSVLLPPGVYDVTAIGTYIHDDSLNPPLQADAECTEGGASRGHPEAWQDPLDVIAGATGRPQAVSTWHPFRYIVNGQYDGSPQRNLTYTTDPLADPFDIYVNGRAVAWVPTFPTPLDPSTNAVDLGCNTATHQYDTVVVSDGATPTVLNVYDPNYADDQDVNNGITIQIGQLAGV